MARIQVQRRSRCRSPRCRVGDNKLVPFLAKASRVFNCPVNKLPRPWTNDYPVFIGHANPSYGYNMSGRDVSEGGNKNLGLSGADKLGRTQPLLETMVRVPSDMIAIADYKPQSDPDND